MAVIEALLRAHKPRLYVTASVLHNPTGRSLTPAVAHQLLRLAQAHELTIVEDDTEALAQVLLDEGWLIAPGTLFHATPRPTSLMRINFATTQDARFWQRLQKLRGGHGHGHELRRA